MDIFSKKKRSEIMSKVKSKDSKIELSLRKALSEMKIRYRKHVPNLPGKPDIAFIGEKTVVFLDSCFWHGCRWHGSIPASNKKFWQAKIERNKVRDKIVNREYKKMGWKVLRIWEHQLKDGGEKSVFKITEIIKGKKSLIKQRAKK